MAEQQQDQPDETPAPVSSPLPWWTRIVAVYHIVGGLAGVVVVYRYLGTSTGLGTVLPATLFGGLYLLSALAGVWLWQGTDDGVRYAIRVQLVQLPFVSSPLLSYFFMCGAALGPVIVLDASGLRLSAVASPVSNFGASLLAPVPWMVGVNLLPLAMLAVLRRVRRLAGTRPQD